MTPSQIEVVELPTARVLVLSGEVDLNVAPQVIDRLPQLLPDARPLVLDLTEVTFFDSSGVRLLDSVSRRCGAQGGTWRVVAPVGSPSRRVLELVAMVGPEVVEDRAAALADLS